MVKKVERVRNGWLSIESTVIAASVQEKRFLLFFN